MDLERWRRYAFADSCAQFEWMEYLTVVIIDEYRTAKDTYMYVRVGHTRYREIVVAVLQMTRGGYSREKEDVCIGAANVSCNWWNVGVVVSIDRR